MNKSYHPENRIGKMTGAMTSTSSARKAAALRMAELAPTFEQAMKNVLTARRHSTVETKGGADGNRV